MNNIAAPDQSFNPAHVLSFDLETTSANPFEARIVTSALVRIDSSGAHPVELLADPGVEIPEAASKVHGISTEYAREHGEPHEAVLKRTVDEIYAAWEEGFTLVVYNAPYDLTVLRQLTGDFVVKGPVYDPYLIDRSMDRFRKGKRTLTDLCSVYGVRMDNAHEATSDALAAARIAWMQAKKRFKDDLAAYSHDELMEYQAVQYYELQKDMKKYLDGLGRDKSTVNFGWPMQNSR
ncbi:3'-5' exonuclease [Corynebacterium diphtheriae]|nr:3'-5' exonuclease [Corynebacterium diphtheriae]